MYNGSYWNFKRSRYNLLGDEVRDIKVCCEESEDWFPEEEEEVVVEIKKEEDEIKEGD